MCLSGPRATGETQPEVRQDCGSEPLQPKHEWRLDCFRVDTIMAMHGLLQLEVCWSIARYWCHALYASRHIRVVAMIVFLLANLITATRICLARPATSMHAHLFLPAGLSIYLIYKYIVGFRRTKLATILLQTTTLAKIADESTSCRGRRLLNCIKHHLRNETVAQSSSTSLAAITTCLNLLCNTMRSVEQGAG